MINDTIAAISTPYGRGGIAVIRISGPDAFCVAQKMFVPKNKKKIDELNHSQAVFGDIVNNGETIDTGIMTIFAGPKSFTGEDTVEISCHGGILIAKDVLQSAFEAGAVQAGPGEFTKRAFVSGKLSLSEAEAVIDLIDAETEDQKKLALAQGKGVLSREINKLYDRLVHILSSVYAYIDYPDEDLRDVSESEAIDELKSIKSELEKLYLSYKSGHAIKDGIKTVFVGKPNVGKSSLMNALLGQNRAIVTDIAGTTRDTIEEKISMGKIILRLIDTAGVRQTGDEVEMLGVQRTIEKAKESELILLIIDTSQDIDESEKETANILNNISGKVIMVVNKADKTVNEGNLKKYRELYNCDNEIFYISAQTGEGIDKLKDYIQSLYINSEISYDSTPIISNARQSASVKGAIAAITSALDALAGGFTPDVAGMDVEEALSILGELDGRTVSQEITNDIFSRFCVGK